VVQLSEKQAVTGILVVLGITLVLVSIGFFWLHLHTADCAEAIQDTGVCDNWGRLSDVIEEDELKDVQNAANRFLIYTITLAFFGVLSIVIGLRRRS